MSLRPRDLVPEATGAAMQEWYCNLVYLDHRKCLLFTHPPTIFSFLVPHVNKADLERFAEIFREHLAEALRGEGIDPHMCLSRLAGTPDAFAKARDRSTLGSMRDHQLNLKWYVERDGGWDRADPSELTKRLNETPMGIRGQKKLRFPRDMIREWLRAARRT